MAKRANQTFVMAVAPSGKVIYSKDQIVPDAVAKKVAALVYDDGAPKKPAQTDG